MIERVLLTPDELKAISKGSFIVMKTGTHSMQTRLQLFLNWSITFWEPYTVLERANRAVAHVNRVDLKRNHLKSDKAEEVAEHRDYGYKNCKRNSSSPLIPRPPKIEFKRELCTLNSFFITNPSSAKKIKNTKHSEKAICKITANSPHTTPARRRSLYIVRMASNTDTASRMYAACRVIPSDAEIGSSANATTNSSTPDQMLNWNLSL